MYMYMYLRRSGEDSRVDSREEEEGNRGKVKREWEIERVRERVEGGKKAKKNREGERGEKGKEGRKQGREER